jgi:proteic killer suppression protein
MILSFRHKGLSQLYERQKDRTAHVARAWTRAKGARILARLDIAREPAHMDLPGWSLHPLRGQMAGAWCVWVTANSWIVFRFTHRNVSDVDLVDFPKQRRRLNHAHEGTAVPRRHGAA